MLLRLFILSSMLQAELVRIEPKSALRREEPLEEEGGREREEVDLTLEIQSKTRGQVEDR
jgi:hypothetical protein